MKYNQITKNPRVCVVGLGYVGLPLAVALGKRVRVYGYDVSHHRIEDLRKGHDVNLDIAREEILAACLELDTNPVIIRKANVIIVCVPTPLKDQTTQPDLRLLEDATMMVGKHLQKNSIVVFESTVWPGTTEEICLPILERESGLKLGRDFGAGYSPERINPGDRIHTIDKVVKVVSGHDDACTAALMTLYRRVAQAGVFQAPSIKVAEAAKIIENTQRDVNIALMNEFSLIFERMGISTYDVLATAKTKWNFLDFYPGLVGGHCIGVDPYYLAYKARELGLTPRIILAGRTMNGFMAEHVARKMVAELEAHGVRPASSRVLVMGLTFKEDVPDIRNSKAREVIETLRSYGCTIVAVDPLIHRKAAWKEFGVDMRDLNALKGGFDGIIIINKHRAFRQLPPDWFTGMLKERGVVFDLKHMLPALKEYVRYITL